MKRILIVSVLFLLLALPALAYTPRRGIQGGRPGDMELVNANWWTNGTIVGEGRGFVPWAARGASGMKYSKSRGWLLTLDAPNVAEGANLTVRQAALELGKIRKLRPYAKLVSPTIKGNCADGSYNYSLTELVREYEGIYHEKPAFDAIGIQTAAATAEESICWIERVVREARALEYDVDGDVEIWIAGFSCVPSEDEPSKETYMQTMLDYFADNQIMRYAWRPMWELRQSIWYSFFDLALAGSDGQLTPLGRIYAGAE